MNSQLILFLNLFEINKKIYLFVYKKKKKKMAVRFYKADYLCRYIKVNIVYIYIYMYV